MHSAVLRITSVPPGEAPFWVRQKWVGLSLPLAQQCVHAHPHRTFGVLSRPKNIFVRILAQLFGKLPKESGYIVASRTAIDLLAQTSPEAADWWRANTPFFLKPGQYFLFQEGVGQVFPTDLSN